MALHAPHSLSVCRYPDGLLLPGMTGSLLLRALPLAVSFISNTTQPWLMPTYASGLSSTEASPEPDHCTLPHFGVIVICFHASRSFVSVALSQFVITHWHAYLFNICLLYQNVRFIGLEVGLFHSLFNPSNKAGIIYYVLNKDLGNE